MNIKELVGKFAIRIEPTATGGDWYLLNGVYVYEVTDTELVVACPYLSHGVSFTSSYEEVTQMVHKGEVTLKHLSEDYLDDKWFLYSSFLERVQEEVSSPAVAQLKVLEGQFAIRTDDFQNGSRLYRDYPVYIHKVTDNYLIFCHVQSAVNDRFFSHKKQRFSKQDLKQIEHRILSGAFKIEIMPTWYMDEKWTAYHPIVTMLPAVLTTDSALYLKDFIGQFIVRTQNTEKKFPGFKTEPLLLLHVTDSHMICYNPKCVYNEKYYDQGTLLSPTKAFSLADEELLYVEILSAEWMDQHWIAYSSIFETPKQLTNPQAQKLQSLEGSYMIRKHPTASDNWAYTDQPVYLHLVTDSHLLIYEPYSSLTDYYNERNGVTVDVDDVASIDYGIKVGILKPTIIPVDWIDQHWKSSTSMKQSVEY